jgi:hypothetical protein
VTRIGSISAAAVTDGRTFSSTTEAAGPHATPSASITQSEDHSTPSYFVGAPGHPPASLAASHFPSFSRDASSDGHTPRAESFTSDRSDGSSSSGRAPAPLLAPTQVMCLQALATCLFKQRQLKAELNVLRDLAHLIDIEGIKVGSAEARKKVTVLRRIGSCLVSQELLEEAVQAFRQCVSQGELLLPNVCSSPPPQGRTFWGTCLRVVCSHPQRTPMPNQ